MLCEVSNLRGRGVPPKTSSQRPNLLRGNKSHSYAGFDKSFIYSQGHNKADTFDGSYPPVNWAIWLKEDVRTSSEDTGGTMDAAASSGGVTRGKAIETHPTYWQRPIARILHLRPSGFWMAYTLWKVQQGDYNV
jgi:hypothetical protein